MKRPPPLPSPSLADNILDAIETIVLVINGSGDVVYANPAAERILGYTAEELLGDGWWHKVERPELAQVELVRERLACAARGEIPVSKDAFQIILRGKDGTDHQIVWNDSKGPSDLLIAAGQDISRLHWAEQLIESRERDFHAIFEGASDGMMILNSDWIYVQANSAASRIFGLPVEEIIGKPHGSILKSPVDIQIVHTIALEKKSYSAETELTRSNGEKCHVEYCITSNFRAGYHLIIMRDITVRRELELQLNQAQKLEAVGRLAGGIAHDFNNMLTAIRGFGDLALQKFPEGGHRRYIEGILKASERAAQTTGQLLAFSRHQVLQPKELDVNNVVTDVLQLIQRLIGEDIELVTLLSRNTGTIMFDPGQLTQILMNLAVNSRDAMPGGGKLIIETRPVFLDDEYVLKHIQVEPGPYVMLAVTDTGTGIPNEVRPHIFEPFYTTKPPGEGSGLGLATVYGIVKQSGGCIWVYSEPGEGTTFKIYLPQATDMAPEPSSVATESRTILVIEDDEVIRTLAVTVLREEGHEVLEAADGSEALSVCQEFDRKIDLVISDICAPGMSGEDLMGYFAVRYPEVAILHMSGFSEQHLHDTHAVPPDAHFIAKPFTVHQLLEKVQQALEQKHQRNPD